jgi:hypothetical protein
VIHKKTREKVKEKFSSYLSVVVFVTQEKRIRLNVKNQSVNEKRGDINVVYGLKGENS